MKFIILFEDNPSAPADIRKIHMGQHLEFLERNSDVIDAAGRLSREFHDAYLRSW